VNFDALIRYGCISAEDLQLFYPTDSVDEAYNFVVGRLTEYALDERGAIL
jgi:hypothetical protein